MLFQWLNAVLVWGYRSYDYDRIYNKNTEDMNYNTDYSSENQASSIACSSQEVLLLSVWELEDDEFVLLLLLSAEGITIEIKHELNTINSSKELLDIINDIEQKYRENNALLLEYKTLNKFQWINQDQTEGHCAELETACRARNNFQSFALSIRTHFFRTLLREQFL